MYQVQRAKPRADGISPGQIIPLASICQSFQLIPDYGKHDIDSTWTTDTVLDLCDRFLLNNWASKYSYQTLW